MKTEILILGMVMLVGCPRTTESNAPDKPVVIDRDGVGLPLGDACRNLRVIGCPEGKTTPSGKTCFEHLTAVLAVVPTECVVKAQSVEDVRSCGSPDTLRFRCRVSP